MLKEFVLTLEIDSPYNNRQIYIAGEFTNWNPVILKSLNDETEKSYISQSPVFIYKHDLLSGIYRYKYLIINKVNGKEVYTWFHDNEKDTCIDKNGVINNYIVVE